MSKRKHYNMAMEAALKGVSPEMRQHRMREELAKAESSPSCADLEACEVCEGGGSIQIVVRHSWWEVLLGNPRLGFARECCKACRGTGRSDPSVAQAKVVAAGLSPPNTAAALDDAITLLSKTAGGSKWLEATFHRLLLRNDAINLGRALVRHGWKAILKVEVERAYSLFLVGYFERKYYERIVRSVAEMFLAEGEPDGAALALHYYHNEPSSDWAANWIYDILNRTVRCAISKMGDSDLRSIVGLPRRFEHKYVGPSVRENEDSSVYTKEFDLADVQRLAMDELDRRSRKKTSAPVSSQELLRPTGSTPDSLDAETRARLQNYQAACRRLRATGRWLPR